MVQKEGKRSFEGFRGIIILLILAKVQSLSPRPGFAPWPGLPAPWSPQLPAVDPTMLDA